MNKSDVIEFFDRYAPTWDADQVDKTPIINRILDNAAFQEGQDVLDVACGTGVMFPYYLERKAASVTGIDISHEMARLAEKKHEAFPNIRVICGDVEQTAFDRKFDQCMVYNAFPHFPDPEQLIATLAGLTREGGRLTVAHGASRETIDNHHKGPASKISNGLMSAQELSALFAPYFDVDVQISSQEMYQVSGIRRAGEVHFHAHAHGQGFHRHAHGHDHGHSHTHSHGGEAASLEEAVALMRYMVSHNQAHAQELCDLALQLEEAGNHSAYRRVMDAVVNYDVGNATLAAVLQELT